MSSQVFLTHVQLYMGFNLGYKSLEVSVSFKLPEYRSYQAKKVLYIRQFCEEENKDESTLYSYNMMANIEFLAATYRLLFLT